MKQFLLSIGFTILITTSSLSQGNSKYIKKELSKLNKYTKKYEFVDGVVYSKRDTLNLKILKFKGIKKRNNHLFCVCKNANDSIVIYKPDVISGYKIEELNFITHRSEEEIIFIKQLKQGKIDLYEKPATPSDDRFLYYLKLTNEQNLFIINPDENNVTTHNRPRLEHFEDDNQGHDRMMFQTKGLNQKFKSFVRIYLDACPQVVNLVEAEFYDINSIPSIVETYNNCAD